ncbi:hypothetical protein B9Z19DRAFT_1009019, partial [Tuber borchii]
ILVLGRTDYIYCLKGFKQIEVHGHDEKRAFSSLISTALSGDFLPTQLVWCGKTT